MTRIMKAAERKSGPRRATSRRTLPPLENGAYLDQRTFHERYEAMEEDVRAELIGGIVYMASPQKTRHGGSQADAAHWLATYSDDTPGVQVYVNATNKLSDESEPEPDVCLLIEPASLPPDRDEYIQRAPELIFEAASTTESIDLHGKKADYEKAGVREYLVAALHSKKVFWFELHQGKFTELRASADGIYRSNIFPGLWLDPEALLRRDRKKLLAVLRRGLATKEHQAFVRKLARNKK